MIAQIRAKTGKPKPGIVGETSKFKTMGTIEILAIIALSIPAYVMGWVHTIQVMKDGEDRGEDLSGLVVAAFFGVFPIPLAFKIAGGGGGKKAKALARAETDRDVQNTQALAYLLMYASVETVEGKPAMLMGGQRVYVNTREKHTDVQVGGLTFTVTNGHPHLVSLKEMFVMGLATISKP